MKRTLKLIRIFVLNNMLYLMIKWDFRLLNTWYLCHRLEHFNYDVIKELSEKI